MNAQDQAWIAKRIVVLQTENPDALHLCVRRAWAEWRALEEKRVATELAKQNP